MNWGNDDELMRSSQSEVLRQMRDREFRAAAGLDRDGQPVGYEAAWPAAKPAEPDFEEHA